MSHQINWSPLEEFNSLFRSGKQLGNLQRRWAPVVDISETKDGYVIHAELPAVKKEDIKLRIAKDTLVLEGERHHHNQQDDLQFHRVERSYGSFQRSFALPDGVDESHLNAEYKDGVLTIDIKKAAPQLAKNIDIKVA